MAEKKQSEYLKKRRLKMISFSPVTIKSKIPINLTEKTDTESIQSRIKVALKSFERYCTPYVFLIGIIAEKRATKFRAPPDENFYYKQLINFYKQKKGIKKWQKLKINYSVN